MYDVIIIGAGVTGSAVARELSRYNANVCVLEKCEDVCEGTSKANSAIMHAGFDAPEGSLMAKMNVRGNEMMDQLAEDLDIPFKRNGAMVVCIHKEALDGLQDTVRPRYCQRRRRTEDPEQGRSPGYGAESFRSGGRGFIRADKRYRLPVHTQYRNG